MYNDPLKSMFLGYNLKINAMIDIPKLEIS